MFRIGDLSRIARVSARLLRFYDEIGLRAWIVCKRLLWKCNFQFNPGSTR